MLNTSYSMYSYRERLLLTHATSTVPCIVIVDKKKSTGIYGLLIRTRYDTYVLPAKRLSMNHSLVNNLRSNIGRRKVQNYDRYTNIIVSGGTIMTVRPCMFIERVH